MASVAADPAPLFTLRGVHKWFPGVHALKGVDLEVRAGEVHAVVGEDGAGKSTLMQVLAGVHRPDVGRIDFAWDEAIVIADERAARYLGIALVFQGRSLSGPLSVAENVFAGRQPTGRLGRIDRGGVAARTAALLEEVGLAVAPETPVERLSPAQQQRVEIAKALSVSPRLILLDEPTAALTPEETGRLFAIVGRLKARGVGVVYISHRLDEVFAIAGPPRRCSPPSGPTSSTSSPTPRPRAGRPARGPGRRPGHLPEADGADDRRVRGARRDEQRRRASRSRSTRTGAGRSRSVVSRNSCGEAP